MKQEYIDYLYHVYDELVLIQRLEEQNGIHIVKTRVLLSDISATISKYQRELKNEKRKE